MLIKSHIINVVSIKLLMLLFFMVNFSLRFDFGILILFSHAIVGLGDSHRIPLFLGNRKRRKKLQRRLVNAHPHQSQSQHRPSPSHS